MEHLVTVLLLLICVGIVVFAVYLCLRSHPREPERIFLAERTNRIRTIPSAPTSVPDDDLSQLPVTNVSQDLFPTGHVNAVDRINYNSNNDHRIPSSNIENGFNHSDHGLNQFADTINDHPLDMHYTSQYSSMDSDHNLNRSTYHKPLKKIDTPPPSYYEATLGYNAVVGRNHSSNHPLIVRNNCESTVIPSGYSGRLDGGRGDGRNGSGYNGGRSSGNSNGRDGDRNATGYSSGRGNCRAYSGGRCCAGSCIDSKGRGGDINAAVHCSSKGDTAVVEEVEMKQCTK